MLEKFFINKRVYYHDTDAGKMVYYANYLNFLEEARTEFCFHRGVDVLALSSEGIYFVVAHIEVDYKSPAQYLDLIKVFTSVEKIGRSSVNFVQEIKKEEKLLVYAKVTWVCVNKDFKPRSVPEIIKDKFIDKITNNQTPITRE